jgi:hypothetical protein
MQYRHNYSIIRFVIHRVPLNPIKQDLILEIIFLVVKIKIFILHFV